MNAHGTAPGTPLDGPLSLETRVAGAAPKVKKATMIPPESSVSTILKTSIDVVLDGGEVIPIVQHLAALLIKFKNKAKELEKTVKDANRKLHWAERMLRALGSLPMPVGSPKNNFQIIR